jgi:alkylation response protein AidB-like acyl-CoA dehydrogenase
MVTLIAKRRFVTLVLCVALFGTSFAKEKNDANSSPPAQGMDWEYPAFVLSAMQKSHATASDAFVVQQELDSLIREGGGGACASAAGIDLLQALRMMAGLEKLSNPHKVVLSSFADQPELLNGRVTNQQFVRLMEFYEQHLEGSAVTVAVQSAPNSRYASDESVWSVSDGPDLSIAPRQLKLLSYTFTTKAGEVRGRHFVLLKDQKRSEVVVVDPGKPVKDRRYILEYKAGNNGDCEEVFLLNPAGTPARTDIYELNTVFTVSLLKSESEHTGTPQPDKAVSLESIKSNIDKTVTELRGGDDFLSPRAWRRKTAGFGLPGLDLPVEYGGSGWPATKVLEVFKHAGTYNLNFRDNVGGAHVRPLLKSTEPAVLDIVRQVAAGEAYIAIAITEPDVGSNVSGIKSTSRRVDGGYELSGAKRFNARLEQATHVIIFTQGTTGIEGKLNVFVLPIGTPGLIVESLEAHGLTGNSYGGLKFENVFVPESHRIGDDGAGLRIFFEHFLYWRLMQTAAALGTGENALEQMAQRLKSREAFGGPIGRFTHLQQPIGQHTTELRMAHALALEAAELIDSGDYTNARPLICGLKAEGVEIALQAVDAAARAFGGEGYSNRVDLGDRLRDLNGLRIADGTTDVMRMEVVRHTFGQEFWEMAVQHKE